MSKIITTESYVADCKLKHGDLYDYSKVVYTNGKNKVEIICNKHKASFWQEANSHKSGCGCPQCAIEARADKYSDTLEKFIADSIAAAGENLDHSEVVYKNNKTNVTLICKIDGHGHFNMSPNNRRRGQGCPKCGKIAMALKQTKTTEQFVAQCKQLAKSENLCFDNTVYKGDKYKVSVRCKDHGPFDVIASNFIHQNSGCPVCAENKFGYRHSLPGFLYVLGTENSEIVKVGITNRNPTTRAKEVSRSSGKKFSVLGHIFSEDGKIPRAKELEMHAWMQENGKPVEEVFDGSTECFTGIQYGQLLCYLLGIQTTEAA